MVIEEVFCAAATVPKGVGELANDTLVIAAMNQPVLDGASLADALTMSAFILSSINIGISTTTNYVYTPSAPVLTDENLKPIVDGFVAIVISDSGKVLNDAEKAALGHGT